MTQEQRNTILEELNKQNLALDLAIIVGDEVMIAKSAAAMAGAMMVVEVLYSREIALDLLNHVCPGIK